MMGAAVGWRGQSFTGQLTKMPEMDVDMKEAAAAPAADSPQEKENLILAGKILMN
jgi:hypothetical protein